MGIRTDAVHAGRADLTGLGVHAPPIDRSSTYPLTSLAQGTGEIDRMIEGELPRTTPLYARLHNPTVARWEQAIAQLEGADAAVAFSSGMAAITAVLLAAGANGGHVVAVRPVYGGTDLLLCSQILGMRVTWAAPDEVADAIEPDTRLVLLETPTNPTLELRDITAVATAAGDVPVMVDTTFATPVLQQPLAHGATYAVHSATKALSGHGDVVAGVVATDADHARGLRQVRHLTGAILDPQAAWLLHRSLPTLPLRVEAAQATASDLARRLQAHPLVADVRHPSLAGCDPHGLVGRQQRGPGSVLAFTVHGGRAAAVAVVEATRRITHAVSLGTPDTLIEHPASLTHCEVPEDVQVASGISAGLLRLSVGLEDADDLWTDLASALDQASVAVRSVAVGG